MWYKIPDFGDSYGELYKIAWYKENSLNGTQDVGGKLLNGTYQNFTQGYYCVT